MSNVAAYQARPRLGRSLRALGIPLAQFGSVSLETMKGFELAIRSTVPNVSVSPRAGS